MYEPIATVVVHRCCERAVLNIQESIQLTPTISPVPTCCEAGAQWECTLVDDKMNVVRWRPGEVGIGGCSSICGDWMWRLDNFHVKTACERLKVGKDHLLICWWTGRRKELRKLGQTEGCQDRGNICVMCEVKIQGLIQWEGHSIVILVSCLLAVIKSALCKKAMAHQGDIILCCRSAYDVILETGQPVTVSERPQCLCSY